jgi:amino acid transporter
MDEQPRAGQASLDELDYAGGGLAKETNWWGAFVIGLAGTILVTGIAPIMVTTLGAASIPLIVVLTITGYLLCLLLAELSAMMPERTGGAPSYAYPAYKDRWPRAAKHINGITSWMYWLGWFPVAPLNMILASLYLADRFGLDTESGFTPINTPIAWWTLGISIVGILLFFIPAFVLLSLSFRESNDPAGPLDCRPRSRWTTTRMRGCRETSATR